MDWAFFMLFTFVSSIEYTTAFIFIFTLFRMDMKGFKYHVLFVCVSLSYLSYNLREDGLTSISPFIQTVVIILFMWLLFRIHLGYAIFISLVGFFGFGLLQALTILGILSLGFQFVPFTFSGYVASAVPCGIMLLLSYLIKRRNRGYTFIPHQERFTFTEIKHANWFWLTTVVLLMVGIGVSYNFTLNESSTLSFLIAFVLLLLLEVVVLITFSNKKEKKEKKED